MERARQGFGFAVMAMLAALAAAHAQTVDPDMVPRAQASNGVFVPMPDIATLDCPGMAEALRRIDLSKYRGPEALSPGDHDWPIFEYEDRLAHSYYSDCMLRGNSLGNPSAAFSFGFQTQ